MKRKKTRKSADQLRRARELQGDPKEAEGLSLLELARSGKRHTRPSTLESDLGDLEFVWRVLDGNERDQANASAVLRFQELELPLELRHYQDLEVELSWQILWRAMRDPRVEEGPDGEPYPNPVAPDAVRLRELLEDIERQFLVTEYQDFELETSATLENLSVEEFEAIEHALKKKETALLCSFGSVKLAIYMLTLAERQETSATSKSSSGSSSASDSSLNSASDEAAAET